MARNTTAPRNGSERTNNTDPTQPTDGGIEQEVSPVITARVEVYQKAFDRTIVGRLETPAETAARGRAHSTLFSRGTG